MHSSMSCLLLSLKCHCSIELAASEMVSNEDVMCNDVTHHTLFRFGVLHILVSMVDLSYGSSSSE